MARLFLSQAAPGRHHETHTRYRRTLVWPRDGCRAGSNPRRCFAEFWRSVLRRTVCHWPTVLPALCASLLLPLPLPLPLPSRSCDRLRTALLPRATRDRRAAASLRSRISSRLVGRKATKEAPLHRRLRSFSIFQQCAYPAIISFPQTPRHSSQLSRPRGESLSSPPHGPPARRSSWHSA